MRRIETKRDSDGPVAAMIRRVAHSARRRNAQLGLFDVDAIIHTLIDELAAELLEKGRLQLPGFGVFKVRSRKAFTVTKLMGKDAHFEIPALQRVTFTAAKSACSAPACAGIVKCRCASCERPPSAADPSELEPVCMPSCDAAFWEGPRVDEVRPRLVPR